MMMQKNIAVEEQYHIFRRGEKLCRWGIFGLSRRYFDRGDPAVFKEKPEKITLQIPEPELKVMQAVITARCNLECSYCSFIAHAPHLPHQDMTPAELEDLCRRFNRQIGPEGLLLITGGEPQLHQDAVDYLVNHIIGKIIIFTNGTCINRERLSFFRRHQVGVLFSLDGDHSAQDLVRKGKNGSYSKVAEALHTARELGVDYGISAVVGDHNIERLPELVAWIVEEFQPASLGLNLPHRTRDLIWDRIEEYTQALLRIFTFAKKTGLFVDQINRRLAPFVERKFRFRDCAAQGNKTVLFPGGEVTSCVNEAGLQGRSVNWGDRLPIFDPHCQDCCAIGICGGGCIFDGEAIYGSSRFDERNCYFTRTVLEHLIWDLWDELGEDSLNPEILMGNYRGLLKRGEGTYLSVGHETA